MFQPCDNSSRPAGAFQFEPTLPLPEGVLTEKLTAVYNRGVLEITAPVATVALPRKIEVKTTAPFAKQIAA